MLQWLPPLPPQVKSKNTSECLLNEIPQIMDTTFMKLENNKTIYPYRLVLNLADKINVMKSDEYIALSDLSINIYYT